MRFPGNWTCSKLCTWCLFKFHVYTILCCWLPFLVTDENMSLSSDICYFSISSWTVNFALLKISTPSRFEILYKFNQFSTRLDLHPCPFMRMVRSIWLGGILVLFSSKYFTCWPNLSLTFPVLIHTRMAVMRLSISSSLHSIIKTFLVYYLLSVSE